MKTTDRPRIGPRVSARRFGITDLMGLILAIVCGLGIGVYNSEFDIEIMTPSGPRIDPSTPQPQDPWSSFPVMPFLPILMSITNAVMLLVPITVMLTALRLHGNRNSLRRLMAEPGFVACLVVSMVTTFAAMKWLLLRVVLHNSPMGSHIAPGLTGAAPVLTAWSSYAFVAGMAVCAAWMTLRLAGRWRPESSWFDRLGRTLGFAWIILVPVDSALEILWLLATRSTL